MYRGYVYDWGTELYYLQSRYYDPETGRFINADGLVTTGQGFIGNNMSAYCLNNPISMYDPDGRCSRFLGFLWKIDCGRVDCPQSENYREPSDVGIAYKYNKGQNYVYIIREDQLNLVDLHENDVVIIDHRKNSNDPKYDQNMQVYNSNKIKNKKLQSEIIQIMKTYNKDNPVTPAWDRSEGSMLIEWAAHNDGHTLSPHIKKFLNIDVSEQCKHVDFNNADEGVSYTDFYLRGLG